ncbi:hypothetical protein [Burkholderia multivorans]|uniref:hypothetical protein n=1 Tax=Burkholderia multivorans TaxID=87883 RepID=UPI001C237A26|nr:hypothetical protein [Burkholderia multivorans]ULR75122.1 hypothetical protein JC1_50 [Burkholderia phage JC1]MBU9386636.1 hypothetical protein [Burkholderia multivorans]MBU9437070.1 hypothetical protein [Burkholderia multivorans]MBU9606275.1 hypothetical protein [Burkholderia multivorans]MBU9624834.1 hypothetical protein [Burkholderia multivorans]
MKIECILRREGGTVVEMPGKTYHFAPWPDGRHVADVEIEAHIERFLSIPEAYRIARTAGAAAVEEVIPSALPDNPPPVELAAGETLLASSAHPASVEIDGKTYTLADVAMRAFRDSGLTVEAWNGLDDETRATKIDIVLDAIADGEIALEPAVAPASPVPVVDERAALVAAYTSKFGKQPPGNMKVETLKAKLAEGAA